MKRAALFTAGWIAGLLTAYAATVAAFWRYLTAPRRAR